MPKVRGPNKHPRKVKIQEQGYSGLMALCNAYRQNAKRDNRVFALTMLQVKEITSKNCEYCGTAPARIKTGTGLWMLNDQYRKLSEYTFNGIDRVDSSIGYYLENCVPCCSWCNYAKHECSVEEFKNNIRRAYLWLTKS